MKTSKPKWGFRDSAWRHCQVPLLSALCLTAISGTEVRAQGQFASRIGYVYPAGGRQGTTFQIAVGGQYLAGVTNAHVTGTGITVTFVEFNRPMNPKEFNEARDELRALQDRLTASLRRPNRRAQTASTNAPGIWTAADDKRMAELRTRILKNPPNRQGNPAIAETAVFAITLATDAPPGERELRLVAPNGLSNPLRFHVGKLREYSRPLTHLPNPEIERLRERFDPTPRTNQVSSEMTVLLPACLNGQMMPGTTDRYRFRASRGQQLVVIAEARALIPYLADAVPGWFQATLALYDARGKELAYADDFRFHPDPVLRCAIPREGEYVLEIKDAIYRGREDFVYRITVGELPFVTGIFPLGGRLGSRSELAVTGWNLPTNNLPITVDNQTRGLQAITVSSAGQSSPPRAFVVDTLPEHLEKEPNDTFNAAPSISLPCIVNGCINKPGDRDSFRFEGRAGEEVAAEVLARRLDSPLDSLITITAADGSLIASNDDHEDQSAGLDTHHADSYLRVRLPTDGAYGVSIADTQGKAGPEFAYRLRVGPPRPDFELRVVPASLNLRAGATLPLTIYALRKDGFTNAIHLELADAPPGFTLSGATVPANQDRIRVTLTAPVQGPGGTATFAIRGRATVAGQSLDHLAVPAEDMMQAFAYRHLVPARELCVFVSERGAQKNAVRVLSKTPIALPVGGTARVRVNLPAKAIKERLHLELSEPPEGISLRDIEPATRTTADLLLECDATKTKPGLAGNLIVNAYAAGKPDNAKGKPANLQRRFLLGTLPALPFEVAAGK